MNVSSLPFRFVTEVRHMGREIVLQGKKVAGKSRAARRQAVKKEAVRIILIKDGRLVPLGSRKNRPKAFKHVVPHPGGSP